MHMQYAYRYTSLQPGGRANVMNNRSCGTIERRPASPEDTVTILHFLWSLSRLPPRRTWEVTGAELHSPPRPKLLRSLGPPELLLTGRLVAGQESANQG